METAIYLAIWGLCGWGAYSIAQNKGYDKKVLPWFAVLGLFLGVFGILITAFFPKKGEALLENGEKIHCPFCDEIISKKALVCPKCQSKLEQS